MWQDNCQKSGRQESRFFPMGMSVRGQGASLSGFCALFNVHGFVGMDCAFIQGVVIKKRDRNFNKNNGRV